MEHEGKVAIVTGGTGALGSVIVRQFLDKDSRVAIPYSSENSLSSVLPSFAAAGDRVFFHHTDITSEEQVQSFTDHVVKRFGTLDYLINAAGGYSGGTEIAEVSLADWDSLMNLNLKSAFLMCRSALRMMKQKSFGRIVTIAAMTALIPSPKKGPYAISKRGVLTLTETIAEETRGTGITANCIVPSIILTEANKQWMSAKDEGKWVTPDEIASMVLFLCSRSARSMSSNAIKMYGGV